MSCAECLRFVTSREAQVEELPWGPHEWLARAGLTDSKLLQLVDDIWDSIARESELLPLTEAQRAELDRRLESYESDPGATRSWAEVRDRIVRDE